MSLGSRLWRRLRRALRARRPWRAALHAALPANVAAAHASDGPPSLAAALAPGPGAAPVQGEPPLALELRYFQWLTGMRVCVEAPLAAAEQRLLGRLDEALASEALRAQLLPRARSVIPHLLHSLRDPMQSTRGLAARVARDPNLVVEVIRMANSAGYRGAEPVGDLMLAIVRLGTEGLRRAVAKVLLKPIFDDQSNPLLARTTARLWQQSEIQADLCLGQAAGAGLDPMDAFMAGLLHNVGWTATFRVLDADPQCGRGRLPDPLSAAFVGALAAPRDQLGAALLRAWDLSPGLNRLADETRAADAHAANGAMAQLLQRADQSACERVLLAAAQATTPRQS